MNRVTTGFGSFLLRHLHTYPSRFFIQPYFLFLWLLLLLLLLLSLFKFIDTCL